MPSTLAADLLAVLDRLSGGVHAGFRPAHAKGTMYSGTFTPGPAAAGLTRAPHANRPSTPVTVRFSLAAGVPTAPTTTRRWPAHRGWRCDSTWTTTSTPTSWPTRTTGSRSRTGEEFLEFLRAVAASGPDAAAPPPIVAFLGSHPTAKTFVEAPKPIPVSFARQAFFAVTAFKFTNAGGATRFGRFRLRPEAGTSFLTADQAAAKTTDFLAAEMSERLAAGPATFRILVQLAEAGDQVADATAVWPENRPTVEFGTLTIRERVDELNPERRKIIFDPLPRSTESARPATR